MTRKKSTGLYLENWRELLVSPAFKKLHHLSVRILLYFWSRLKKEKRQVGKHEEWVYINSENIVFTYAEAKRMGISRQSFVRSLDDLISHGFLRIVHSGNGFSKGDNSVYAISSMWRDYESEKFKIEPRVKDTREFHKKT